MNGADLIPILKAKGVQKLFHANTATTSCTFLQIGGLASRGYIDRNGLLQTPQDSDDKDRKFGVWDDVFLDTADIHERARKVNSYGPVLFALDVEVLGRLPAGSDVRVTKKNPMFWHDGQAQSDRLFTTLAEIQADLVRGRFEQMLMLRVPDQWLPFPAYPVPIELDDPQQTLPSGAAFDRAAQLLNSAGAANRRGISVVKRRCQLGCMCLATYAKSGSLGRDFDQWQPPAAP